MDYYIEGVFRIMSRYLYHKHGDDACFQKGLEYLPDTDPKFMDTIRASEFLKLNGNKVYAGQEIICGSCGKLMQYVCYQDISE